MFKKPFHVKTSTKLRSSDTKKLKNQVKLEVEWKDVSSTKMETHNQDIITAFSMGDVPLLLQLDLGPSKVLEFPSVQAGFRQDVGSTFKRIVANRGVMGYILNGADLFRPGVNDAKSDDWQKGDVVVVTNGRTCPPFSVGVAACSKSDLQGNAVHVYTVFGDYFWQWKPVEGVNVSSFLEQITGDESDSDDSETSQQENVSIEESTHLNQQVEDTIQEVTENLDQLEVKSDWTMDQLFQRTLLQAITKTLLPGISKKTISLPINSGVLWNTYLIPLREPGTPELDIKATSYKKLSKFLHAMEKEGLIKCKDVKSSGDVVLREINASHPMIQEFRPWKLEPIPVVEEEKSEGMVEIVDLYRLNNPTLQQLFSSIKLDEICPDTAGIPIKERLFTTPQIKTILNEIAKEKELVNASNQAIIFPHKNDVLKPLYKTTDGVTREEYLTTFLKHLQSYHLLSIPGQEAIVKKGAPKKITLIVSRRGGSSYITLIENLEEYLPNTSMEKIREELAKYCAASVSLAKDGHLQVQGTPIKELFSWFKTRVQLPIHGKSSNYVEIIDKYGVTSTKRK